MVTNRPALSLSTNNFGGFPISLSSNWFWWFSNLGACAGQNIWNVSAVSKTKNCWKFNHFQTESFWMWSLFRNIISFDLSQRWEYFCALCFWSDISYFSLVIFCVFVYLCIRAKDESICVHSAIGQKPPISPCPYYFQMVRHVLLPNYDKHQNPQTAVGGSEPSD